MKVTLASDVAARAPMLRLGLLSMRGLTIRAKDDDLWQALEQAAAAVAAHPDSNSAGSGPSPSAAANAAPRVARAEGIARSTAVGTAGSRVPAGADARVAAVRRLFKAVGVDPSRYRPSSEALVRRAAQGKGLYQINTAVDVNNWCSLEERLPFGIYDAQRIGSEVLLQLGRENAAYEGIGKSLVSLEGKLLLSDEHGAFGSPISDSTRAMVTEQTQAIHVVVFAADVTRDVLHQILHTTAERMSRYNGGTIEELLIVGGAEG